ncbi:hypothetical protein LQT47_17040 [Escherichia coli]|nr:hypothetical protein LQT47_17040 [Escherichia coli]
MLTTRVLTRQAGRVLVRPALREAGSVLASAKESFSGGVYVLLSAQVIVNGTLLLT